MFGRIFKFARSIVENLLNMALQAVNSIQEQVTAPLRTMVNSVVGGVWRGGGADRFVEEMTSQVIPMLVGIAGINSSFINSIRKSTELIEQAEKQAVSQVQQLIDVFDSIF